MHFLPAITIGLGQLKNTFGYGKDFTSSTHLDWLIQTFIDLNKEGQTIVMVTHEPEYAKLAHRTITMADGKVLSDVMNKK